MKNLFKACMVVLIVAGSFTTTKAQHEIKTNVAGLIFNQFGLTYEYVLNENMGILGGVAYFTSPGSFSYEYSAFSIAPEFRYYFNPDDDAEGYFIGGYIKYRNTSAPEYLTTFDNNGNATTIGQNTNGVALGIVSGRKWVTRSGFMFETWAGFGRYLVNTESYTDGYEPDALTQAFDDLPAWDFRLGLTAGWRFGR